jgi:chromatin remodeling complex protein RSC6
MTMAKAKKGKRTTAKRAAKKKAPARKSARKAAPKKKAPARKAAKRAAPKKKKRAGAKRKPNAAFMKAMMPSSELAAVVGDRAMPRTEITKRVWDYIKKNKLQDTVNRRMINADDKLRPIFGGKRQVSMFEMTAMVAKHLR